MLLEEAKRQLENSSCLSKRVGAVIAIDGNIIASGYNESDGVLCGDGGCGRCLLRVQGRLKHGEGRDICVCIHAEINAIKSLGANSGYPMKHGEMVVTIPPCLPCAEAITEAGIRKVSYPRPDHSGAGVLHLIDQGIVVEELTS